MLLGLSIRRKRQKQTHWGIIEESGRKGGYLVIFTTKRTLSRRKRETLTLKGTSCGTQGRPSSGSENPKSCLLLYRRKIGTLLPNVRKRRERVAETARFLYFSITFSSGRKNYGGGELGSELSKLPSATPPCILRKGDMTLWAESLLRDSPETPEGTLQREISESQRLAPSRGRLPRWFLGSVGSDEKVKNLLPEGKSWGGSARCGRRSGGMVRASPYCQKGSLGGEDGGRGTCKIDQVRKVRKLKT